MADESEISRWMRGLSPEALRGLNELLLEQREQWIDTHGEADFEARRGALVSVWLVQAFDFFTNEMLEEFDPDWVDTLQADGISDDPADWPDGWTRRPDDWPVD